MTPREPRHPGPQTPGATALAAPPGEKEHYLDGLSQNQEAALLALLSEPTVTKAGEKSGVHARTIYKWLEKDQRFINAYRLARRQAFQQAMAMTHRYAPMAIQALAKIMTDTASPASARVAAATAILNFARQSIELDDLAERVRALEQAAAPDAIPLPGPEPTPPVVPEAPGEQRDAA